MKAITLWQPYASLVAIKAKPFETRAFPPPAKLIGQRIAIHAAARKVDRHTVDGLLREVDVSRTDAAVIAALLAARDNTLPLGAVVCTAVLAGAYQCGRPLGPNSVGVADVRGDDNILRSLSIRSDPFGDYSPGRWAWRLTDVEPLDPPVPAKGKQGWWEWDEGRVTA